MTMLRNFALAAAALTAVSTVPASADDKTPPTPIAIPAPPAGKGQIVFFRPGGMGFAVGCSVNENGKKISSLGAGRYFVMTATPGKHDYTAKSEAKDTLTLNVEDGETQYATCKIKMGIIVGRPDIRPSTEADFRKQNKLKMVDSDDMGPGEGALTAERVAAALGGAPAPVPPPAPAPVPQP